MTGFSEQQYLQKKLVDLFYFFYAKPTKDRYRGYPSWFFSLKDAQTSPNVQQIVSLGCQLPLKISLPIFGNEDQKWALFDNNACSPVLLD